MSCQTALMLVTNRLETLSRRVSGAIACLAILGISTLVLRASGEADCPTHAHEAEGQRSTAETNCATLSAAAAAKFTQVRFSDIFVTPAGPNGMEYSKSIRELNGKPVRVSGFMVRQVNKDPAVFMLTEFPVSTMEHEYGVADSVPPNVVHALVPLKKGYGTAWQPYAVTVYGRLELDGREEADGRVSYARIQVDHVTVGPDSRLIDVMLPLAERDVNLGRHRHQH